MPSATPPLLAAIAVLSGLLTSCKTPALHSSPSASAKNPAVYTERTIVQVYKSDSGANRPRLLTAPPVRVTASVHLDKQPVTGAGQELQAVVVLHFIEEGRSPSSYVQCGRINRYVPVTEIADGWLQTGTKFYYNPADPSDCYIVRPDDSSR